MSGEVARLRSEEPAKVDQPALGFSLQFDLGSGRVATMQTFLPNDCDQAALDGMLDKMTASGDRQRAKYQIEELEREEEKYVREQEQHQEDLANQDKAFDERQEIRTKEVERLQKELGEFDERLLREWNASAKRGTFKAGPRDESRRKAQEGGIQEQIQRMAEDAVERDNAHKNSQTTFDRRAKLLERTRAEIAKCKAIVAGKAG